MRISVVFGVVDEYIQCKYKTFIIEKLVGDYKYRPIQNILVMNSDRRRG